VSRWTDLDPHPRRRARPTPRPRILAAAVAVAAVASVAAGCSDGPDPVGSDRDRERPTTTLPEDAFGPGTTPGEPEEPAEPPTVAWVSQFGGTGDDRVAGVAGRDLSVLAVGTTDGVVGLAPGTSAGGVDALVAALATEDGSVTTLGQRGGPGDDAARAVAAATDAREALVCGDTSSALGSPSGLGDAWCAPVDEDGSLGAVVQSGTTEPDSLDAVSVAPDGSSGMTAGSTVGLYPGAQDPTGGLLGVRDALVVRVDPVGQPVWARQFGTAGTDTASAVAPVPDGDAVVAGTTDGALEVEQFGAEDGWMARFDPFGNLRWITQLGTTAADRFFGVAAGGDARRGTELFCAVGSTGGALGDTTLGSEDAVAVAVDATGDRLWTTQFGSAGDDRAAAVATDGGSVYVAATVGGPVDGAEEAELPSGVGGLGGRDVLLAGLDAATGELRWAVQLGGPGDEEATSLAVTEQGLVVLGGATTGQLAATPPGGGTDGFVVAFTPPAGGGGAASSV
jgi:hypothetical protein